MTREIIEYQLAGETITRKTIGCYSYDDHDEKIKVSDIPPIHNYVFSILKNRE